MIRNLFLILILLSINWISCTQAETEKPPIDSSSGGNINFSSQETETSQDIELSPASQDSGFTPELIAEAHKLLPPYPNAQIDEAKGSISDTTEGKLYNLVYYTTDSISDVADFFRKNISEQYLSEISDPESKEWIHFVYKVEGIKHEGKIYLRNTHEGTTEIIYAITREISK